jgi:hypothetical protein
VKKALGSILTLFGLMATVFLIAGGSAQANTPPSNCVNGQVGLVNAVICEIDINDNSVLDGNDIVVEVLNKVANGNEINALVVDLDNLTVNIPVTVQDVVNIKNVTVGDLNVDPSVIVVLPCGCSH